MHFNDKFIIIPKSCVKIGYEIKRWPTWMSVSPEKDSANVSQSTFYH